MSGKVSATIQLTPNGKNNASSKKGAVSLNRKTGKDCCHNTVLYIYLHV